MCGVIASNRTVSDFKLALTELEHRGPDYSCIEVWSGIQIGFSRLAIRGLGVDGNQPFFCECGRWSIIYNGEISNWSELMNEYGFLKKGTCDGQIIAPLLCELGVEAFSRIKGMFSIIAHDRNSGNFFAARDPLGIKPLYLWQSPGRWALCSEIRPLLRMNSMKHSADSIMHFLTFGFLSPRQSGFENLTLIEPGKIFVFDSKSLINELDCNLQKVRKQVSRKKNLRESLSEIIFKNSETEVTTALAYSSGFDSNLIATLLAERGMKIELLHIASVTEHHENELVEKYASKLNLNLTIVEINKHDVSLEDYFSRMDRLTFDGLNSYLLSRTISRQHIKTFLTGHGGDEFLRGYKFAQSKNALLQEMIGNTPARTRKLILDGVDAQGRGDLYKTKPGGILNRFPRYYAQSRSVGLSPNSNSFVETKNPSAFNSLLGKLQLSNQDSGQIFHYLAGLSLLDLDQFSMSFSIEARPPIVDFEILTLLREEGIKSKRSLAQRLNDESLMQIVKARKQGFSLDIKKIIEDNIEYVIENLQSAPSIPYLDISKNELNKLIDNRGNLNQGSSNVLWQLLTLCKWNSNAR